MQESCNLSFSSGMNTDLDKSVRDPNSYLRAENFTLSSVDGGTTSALESARSNIVDTTISFAVDHKVVGYANVVRNTVYFTTDGTDSNIYYHEEGVGTTLKYSDATSTSKLNFSLDPENRIVAIGRQELEELEKVYWVDGLNPFRYINLNADYIGKEAVIFDHVPDADFTADFETSIVEGGDYKAGVVQHAYQFYNLNGASSTISELSKSVKLTDRLGQEGGNDIDEDTNCSVKVSINNIEIGTSNLYDRLRIYSLFYDTYGGVPQVDIVGEYLFDGSNEFIVVDNGIHEQGSVSLEEFISFKESTYSANAITSKNNILFLGGIEDQTFQSDAIDAWDSRAYRFEENGNTAYLYKGDGSYDLVQGVNNANGSPYHFYDGSPVPIEHDCIAPYNNIYTTNYISRHTNGGYKHIGDGTAIGGEGINVKYTFESHLMDDEDDNGNTLSEFSKSDYYTNSDQTVRRELIECQHGDVYRIGVKFYNSKGQSSFVKWVGDVLFEERPDFSDHVTGATFNNKAIRFTGRRQSSFNHVLKMEIKNFPADANITSWQIVRAKREKEDRSIIASGILAPTVKFTGEDFYRPYYHISSTGGGENTMYSLVDTLMYYNGQTIDGNTDISSTIHQFISPDLMFNEARTSLGNCLAVVNYRLENTGVSDDPTFSNHYISSTSNTTLTPYSAGVDGSLYHIQEFEYTKPQHAQTEQIEKYVRFSESERYLNQARSVGDDNYAGANSSAILKFENNLNAVGTEAISRDLFFANILQNRDRTRYGGITFTERANTDYIPFSDITPVATTTAYGTRGDVWTTKFDMLHLLFQDTSAESKESIQHFMEFPVQSTIDFRYRSDEIDKYVSRYASEVISKEKTMFVQETVAEGLQQQGSVYDTDIGDLYRYNNVYSEVGDYKVSFPKPVDFTDTKGQPTKIIASEEKISGENIDQWTTFLPNNFIEVDSAYGEINTLKNSGNNVFFWQDRAFGTVAVNDRSLITDQSGAQLSLGTGGVLERYDYISQEVGNVDKYNIEASDNSLYWTYSPKGNVYMFNGQLKELSTSEGIKSYMNSKGSIINPITIVDSVNNEVLFKLNDEVLVYDLLFDKFTGIYTFNPEWFVRMFNGNYKSSDNNEDFYTHNSTTFPRGTYYGVTYPSTIKHICTEGYPITKVFDTLKWDTTSIKEADTIPYDYKIEFLEDIPLTSDRLEIFRMTPLTALNDVLTGQDVEILIEEQITEDTRTFIYQSLGNAGGGDPLYTYPVFEWVSRGGATGPGYLGDGTFKLELTNDNSTDIIKAGTVIYLRNIVISEDATGTVIPYEFVPLSDSRISTTVGGYISVSRNPINQYGDTFSRYRIYNDYQNTDWQDLKCKRKERSFTTYIPRDRVNAPQSSNVDIFDVANLDATQTYKRRIRDKYCILDLEYDNSSGNKFSIPYITCNYRQSIR